MIWDLIQGSHKKDLPASYPHVWLSFSKGGKVGRGISWDEDIAKLKSTMEALERSACQAPLEGSLHWGSGQDFGSRIRGINKQDERLRWWCEAQDMKSEHVVLLPLEYSQIESFCTVSDPLVKKDSTGFAAHFDYASAVRNGINEVFERAGTYNIWEKGEGTLYTGIQASDSERRLHHIFKENGYDVVILVNEPVSGFTSSCCFLKKNNSNEGPALVVGCGGHHDMHAAAENAMMEAFGQLINSIEFFSASTVELDALHPFHFYMYQNNAETLMKRILDGSRGHKSKAPAPPEEIFVINHTSHTMIREGVHVVQAVIPDLPLLDNKSPGICDLPSPFI